MSGKTVVHTFSLVVLLATALHCAPDVYGLDAFSLTNYPARDSILQRISSVAEGSGASILPDSTNSACAATLSSDLILHIPAITINGQLYWADFKYIPNTPDFLFTQGGAVMDTGQFSSCFPSDLSPALTLHVPEILFNGLSSFADLQYAGDLVFSVTAAGANALYELLPGTTYQEGCIGPCLCPITSPAATTGTFKLIRLSPEGLFTRYQLSEISWTVRDPRGNVLHLLTGQGLYKLQSGSPQMHQLTLALSIDGAAPQDFDSSLIPAASEFPSISLSLDRGTTCPDILLSIEAGPGVQSYAISITQGTGGTVSCNGNTTSFSAPGGTDVLCTVTADPGYQVTSIMLDNVMSRMRSSYGWTDIAAGHSISASFSPVPPPTYMITISAGPGGAVNCNGNTSSFSVIPGTMVSCTITANSGYKISGVSLDGFAAGGVNALDLGIVGGNHSISASFSNDTPTPNPPPPNTNATDLGPEGQVNTLLIPGSGSAPWYGELDYYITVPRNGSAVVVNMSSTDWSTGQSVIVGLASVKCTDITGRGQFGPSVWSYGATPSNFVLTASTPLVSGQRVYLSVCNRSSYQGGFRLTWTESN